MTPVVFFCRFLLPLLLVMLPCRAVAGVVLSLAKGVDPQAQVVVEAKIRYSGLHGSSFSPLGQVLLSGGESRSLSKLAVIPILYGGIVANAYHPAYYLDSVQSKKMPLLLRRVELPVLKPRGWAGLLDSGEPLREGGVGITAGAVNDHFYMVLRYFLPAFDRLGGTEDLRRHIPLLEKLAAFAHTPQALANSQKNMRRFSRNDPDRYVESVKKTEGGYRLQLMHRLLEIKGWLALDQQERRPMWDWLENLRRPGYVFRQIMDEADRQKVLELLRGTSVRGHKRSVSWTNPETRVRFSFALRGTSRDGDRYGYSTLLSTDLNPRLGLSHKTRYGGQCYPRFFEDGKGGWELREK